MSRFVIHGGRALSGEIRASGSKNAVLPMIAAALLTDEEVVLENVPSIRDVDVMLEIAGVIGAQVSRSGDRVTIRAADMILVLDDGRVAAQGTHDQLLESSPIYREIYESQMDNGAIIHE